MAERARAFHLRRLIALMGGELQLESEVGKGSTFSFGLHWKRAKKEEAQVPEEWASTNCLPAESVTTTRRPGANYSLADPPLAVETVARIGGRAVALYEKSAEEGRPTRWR